MLLKPKDAAERAGVSISLVYQWCKEGLPHFRFGGKGRRGSVRIQESDLVAFIEKCMRPVARLSKEGLSDVSEIS